MNPFAHDHPSLPNTPVEPDSAETMTPFNRVPRNVMTGMLERGALLSQPPEVFQSFFGGRTPTLAEKIQFVEGAIQRMTSLNIYENNLYHVEIAYAMPFIHLNIHRHDGGACKNWRHFQEIKNELVGSQYEAVELFPAESRLVDTSNEYHLWVCADPSYRFQFGISQPPAVPVPEQAPEITPIPTDRVARTTRSESPSRPGNSHDFGN